jgi:hypothetical protein
MHISTNKLASATAPVSETRSARPTLRGFVSILWLGLGFCGCSKFSPEESIAVVETQARPEVALREMTGARTRLVWIQDQDDQRDWRGKKNNFKIKALETEGGSGERDLLPHAGHFTKPMITPRGDRVVFTDSAAMKVFVVDWDGASLRELADGYGVAVWLDRRSGTEWVYVQNGTNTTDKTFDKNPIKRLPIDNPTLVELVWDKTPVSTRWHGNFQLSADGTRAGGLFPWPETGVAELPNKAWNNQGNGCWTSFTSDGTDRFWKFDGSHRNLRIYSPGHLFSTKVNISIDGYEVYHPRWANLDRFLVQSGPYNEEAEGAKGGERIDGGGRGVEIYLGRFDPEFKRIEKWVQVTRNDGADFFPDAWIEPVSPYASTQMRPSQPGTNAHAAATTVECWPDSRDSLVFVWEDGSKKNEVADPAPNTARNCRVEARGQAKYGRYFVMDFSGGGAFLAQDADAPLLDACKSSNQFSIEAVLTPDRVQANRLACIATFSAGQGMRNFTLAQENDKLVFLLRTAPGRPEARLEAAGLRIGQPHHVVATYAAGKLALYLNGIMISGPVSAGTDLSGWTNQHLLFGDDWGGGADWSGELEGIALYSRALPPEEAKRNAARYTAVLRKRKPATKLRVQAQLKAISATPTPQAIAPYRRCLVVADYEVERVISGSYDQKQIQVAHWGLMDGRVLAHRARKVGASYQLLLQPVEEHPQLESERLSSDSTNFDVPLYYDPVP